MEPIIDKQKITDVLEKLELEIDEYQLDRLSKGFSSDLFKNIRKSESDYVDGKIQFTLGKDGEPQLQIDEQQQKLIIPPTILGHTLNEEEVEKLHQHQPVTIEGKNHHKYVLQIDEELRKVVVKKGVEFTKLVELGGYKPTDKEQELLQQGKTIGPKVLFDQKTQTYIQANIAITDDHQGIELSNQKQLTIEEAKALIPKFNEVYENSAGLGASILANSSIEPVVSQETDRDLNHNSQISDLDSAPSGQKPDKINYHQEQAIKKAATSNTLDQLDKQEESSMLEGLEQLNSADAFGDLSAPAHDQNTLKGKVLSYIDNSQVTELKAMVAKEPKLKDPEFIKEIYSSDSFTRLNTDNQIGIEVILNFDQHEVKSMISTKENDSILNDLTKLNSISSQKTINTSQYQQINSQINKQHQAGIITDNEKSEFLNKLNDASKSVEQRKLSSNKTQSYSRVNTRSM